MKTIQLTQGYVATVDDAKYASLSENSWRASVRRRKNGQIIRIYAVRWTRGSAQSRKMIYMHREILGLTDEKIQADHRDHDGLNNRVKNLRTCSNQQNVWHQKLHNNNTSGYKGVSWHAPAQKWRARIVFNGVERHLGVFSSKKEAVAAHNAASVRFFGEFAFVSEAA